MIDRIVAVMLDTPDAAGGTLRNIFDTFGIGSYAEPTIDVIARAVLTALREPSPHVLKVGEIADFDQGATLAVWQSMIDAAISDARAIDRIEVMK